MEFGQLQSKIEDEQSLVSQLQKKIKELQVGLKQSQRLVQLPHLHLLLQECDVIVPSDSRRGAGGGAGGRAGVALQS